MAPVVLAYAALTLLAVIIGALRGDPNVLRCVPSHAMSSTSSHLASLAGGVVLAALLVFATRWLVKTRAWATALHEDLRPFARALGPSAILPVAIASAIGEETLFRGALVPAVGVVISSVLFGALHQMRGRSRFVWALFAFVVGLALAGLFRVTGSLLGPIVAHAAVNAVNLRFLLEHDPARRPMLGGLLRS